MKNFLKGNFMLFSNLIIYKFKQEIEFNNEQFNEALEQDMFRHCGEQELSTLGWTKAFGKHGEALCHFSNRKILVCAKREEKVLPAAVINEIVAEKIEQIELEENRTVKKKERDELKENTLHTLLPQAFTKSSLQYAFIDMDSGLLVVNSASFGKAEELTALLRKSLGTLPIVPAFGEFDLDVFLTDWLTNFSTPANFSIGTDAEMQEADDSGAIVKLKGHDLQGDEIKAHLDLGKRVTKLALNWKDRIKFNFQNDGAIKQVGYSDTLKEENADIPAEDMPIKLDADFILIASELVEMVTELTNGGLVNGFPEDQDDTNESLLSKFQDKNGNDEFYNEAVEFVQKSQHASVSRIQRKFRIGYNRAARLVEQLEANGIITVPVNPEFPSLNLGQCVLLTGYEWRRQTTEIVGETTEMAGAVWANQQEVAALADHYEDRMDEAGFFFPEHKADSMKLNLRNLWSRMPLTRADVQTLHGVLRQIVRWKEKGGR